MEEFYGFRCNNKRKSFEILTEFLSITSDEIQNFICNNTDTRWGTYTTKVTVENLLSEFDIHFPLKNIEKMPAKIIHISTNSDDCSSVLKYGLGGIQHALSHDTPLSLFLQKEGIVLDLDNQILLFNNRKINIGYDVNFCDLNHPNEIGRKIYSDNYLNGFFRIKNPTSYRGYVHLRPEILKTMDNVLKTKLCERWEGNSTCYEILFQTPVSNVVILEKCQSHLTMEQKSLEIANYLVQKALDVVSLLDIDEIFVLVRPCTPSTDIDIISITNLTSKKELNIH